MVLLTTTPAILHALTQLPPELRSTLNPSQLPSTTDSPIAHSTLITLSCLARQHALPNLTLNTLLRGTRVYRSPPPAKTAPTPEYTALMARLRLEQEAREYRLLTSKNTDGTGIVSLTAQDPDATDDALTPSIVLNVLLTVIMCGLAIFHLTRWWGNDALRALFSMLVAVIVGVAEVVVYAGYMRKIRLGKERERMKAEKKVLIGEYKGLGDEVALQLKDSEEGWEKEEIWGRGKHGGMRRRVRERWDKEQEQEVLKEQEDGNDTVVKKMK